MNNNLFDIFDNIRAPSQSAFDNPIYAVMPVPGYGSYFVGKDSESLACLLVSTSGYGGRRHPPIRLESLEAQFDLPCNLKREGGPKSTEIR